MNQLFQLQPIAFAISLCTLAQFSYAEHEHDVYQLPVIVVTAQQNTTANGLIVTADPKQPIQPVPASDGAAYLKSIMGFNSIQSGGTNGEVSFRGMFGSRIKILTDGTENLGACPSRMDAPTSYISPESFDEIQVIKGIQTVAYANTASAATVIFSRKAPQFDEQPYQGQASVVMGSYGRLDHTIDTAIGHQQVYARLNATRSESDSYQDGNGDTVPSSWQKWSSDIALGWTPNGDTQLELHAGRSDGEALYAGRSMDGAKFARESVGLKYHQADISEHIRQLEAQIDYNFNDHVMDNFSLRPFSPTGGMSMPMASNVSRKTLNARLATTLAFADMQLKTGIDQQYNQHAQRGGMSNSYVNKPRIKDMEFQSYGVFAELTTPLSVGHTLVTGLRADEVNVKDLRAASKTAGYQLELNKTLPSGFIRLESENSQGDIKHYIGVGYVERMPDYWELFSPAHGNMGSSNTFNGVNPEKTTQLDLGVQYQHGAFNLSTSAYVGQIQDYILMRYHHHAMAGMSHGISAGASNVDAVIAGAETGLSYQFNEQITADANLAYAWGKNTTDDITLPQIAPLEGRFNLRYVQDNYSLGAYLRTVAKQNRIAHHQGNIVGYDITPSKGFATLALNGTYRFNQAADISLGIDNVLNKTYAEHLNKAGSSGFGYASEQQFNNIGRNYWARMSIKF